MNAGWFRCPFIYGSGTGWLLASSFFTFLLVKKEKGSYEGSQPVPPSPVNKGINRSNWSSFSLNGWPSSLWSFG